MKNLLSMVDFVFEQQKKHLSLRDFNITNYANFLNLPLELWMFVPCDEDGSVLEEPNECDCNGYTECCGGCVNTYPGVKYQQAKERCLFNGFSLKEGTENKVTNHFTDIQFLNFSNGNKEVYLIDFTIEFPKVKKIYTIEDLVKYNLELTATAQKQIVL